MSFIKDLILSKKRIVVDTRDHPPNKVLEVDHNHYAYYEIIRRCECLLLYGNAKIPTFDIVLQCADFEGKILSDFSLCRFNDANRAQQFFDQVKDKIPVILKHCPSIIVVNSLQSLMDYIRFNPHQTLTHLAANFGFNEIIIKEPERCRAEINLQCKDTLLTPLHLTIKNNKPAILSALLTLEPDLSIVDKVGSNVFHFAASSCKEIIAELCKALSTEPDKCQLLARLINSLNNEAYTPLHLACIADKPECVKEFLKHGVDFNSASIRLSSLAEFGSACINAEIIEQLDTKSVNRGGTPLHWAQSPGVMEVLIEKGCDIDAKNFCGETVLHLMTKKQAYDCICFLLSHGADVDAVGPNGDTSLHMAARNGDANAVQALVTFGANVNCVNLSGETPRHIAAASWKKNDWLIYILNSVGSQRCSVRRSSVSLTNNCTEGCAPNATFNGRYKDSKTFERTTSIYDPLLNDIKKYLNRIKDNSGDDFENSDRNVKLLCLDGGGIRGLVLIQMLVCIERVHKVRIIDSFNWIAGTSTGGILALALANGKSAVKCRQLYFQLKDKIFDGSRPYESLPLETFLKKEFGEERRMSDIRKPRVMITATIGDKQPVELYLFRNYESAKQVLSSYQSATTEEMVISDANPMSVSNGNLEPDPPFVDHFLWEAGRSTGAAPTYFNPCGRYLDGGLISNNPTLDVLTEITQLNAAFASTNQNERSFKLKLVVSLGTGAIPVKNVPIISLAPWNTITGIAAIATTGGALLDLLVNQATQADGQVIERARAWCSSIDVPYFRLNPPLSENINLNETSNLKLISVLWETSVFMQTKHDEIVQMVQLLTTDNRIPSPQASQQHQQSVGPIIQQESSLPIFSE